MTSDDIKKIFLGQTLFRLDTVLGSRLVPILYALGLAALLLGSVAHLVNSFTRGFADGLWGLLEIAVFGLLWLVALRILCEVLLVFFKVNDTATRTVGLARLSNTLMDDVRDAISDIADEDEDYPSSTSATAHSAASAGASTTDEPPPVMGSPRRTAKRTPPAPKADI